jgi:HAD superfamily hydrolase (TIGR01459 family)
MHHITAFGPLAAKYDGFILDLWGVIHDGVTPYPGAADCLRALQQAGKRVVLLSNAPRRAHVAASALRAMGIPDTLYNGIMTSGEATWRALSNPEADPWFSRLGSRVFHLGPERDRNVFETLPLILVNTPAEADVVVNTGPDDLGSQTDVSEFYPVLSACHAARLPMICANPDLEVIRGGTRVICAGALAQHYASLGGDVRWLGKPDPAIYTPVLSLLGVDRTRVLAVGDALRTDIAGADSVGIDSCWVLGGIHGAELGHDPAKIDAAAAEAGLEPVACIPSFIWA